MKSFRPFQLRRGLFSSQHRATTPLSSSFPSSSSSSSTTTSATSKLSSVAAYSTTTTTNTTTTTTTTTDVREEYRRLHDSEIAHGSSDQEYIVQPTSNGSVNVSKASESIRKFGFVILPEMYQGKELEILTSTFVTHTNQVLKDLKQETQRTGEEFQVGSAHGYHEVCLRSPGRYDVSNQFSDFQNNQNNHQQQHLEQQQQQPPIDLLTPIENISAKVLGENYVSAFCGVVLSQPGSEAQQWHADSLHVEPEHKGANLLNGLLALHDISMEMGPTEFAPMTHLLTNHMSNPSVNGVQVVYQTIDNLNRPELVGAEKSANVCLPLLAGSVILFDDRVLRKNYFFLLLFFFFIIIIIITRVVA